IAPRGIAAHKTLDDLQRAADKNECHGGIDGAPSRLQRHQRKARKPEISREMQQLVPQMEGIGRRWRKLAPDDESQRREEQPLGGTMREIQKGARGQTEIPGLKIRARLAARPAGCQLRVCPFYAAGNFTTLVASFAASGTRSRKVNPRLSDSIARLAFSV